MGLHVSKREGTRLHALKRARQRYGSVDAGTHKAIARAIEREIARAARQSRHHSRGRGGAYTHPGADYNPACVCEQRDATSRQVWRVTIEERTFRVAFETATSRIVTFLPLEPMTG